MGSNFVGGNKNIILTIDKDKYSIQDFASYIQNFISSSQKIDSSQLEEILSIYAGNKLIDKEIEYFEIKLSNKSLSQLLQNQKDFKRNNVFSRVEYEKFLLQNNIRAVTFENNLLYNEKKKQFLDFIGGGIVPHWPHKRTSCHVAPISPSIPNNQLSSRKTRCKEKP